MRSRFPAVVGATTCLVFVLAVAGPALACGGLIGPNGGVSLVKTTTLAGYHDGVEHYVTAFSFTGGTGNFGSIIPLPGVPTRVEKGGNWTLQRLVKEVTPPSPTGLFHGDAIAAAAAPAEVLQQVRVDALDLTVLKGAGASVGTWAKDNGFSLPPDAPALLDFYANRSPIFLAAKFDAAAARAQGLGQGGVTPIHISIPTANPWVPLAILGLGKQPSEFIQADVFLLTDQRPSMLPAPAAVGSDGTSTTGLTLTRSEPGPASLISDLRSDQGMDWIPQTGMYLSYLQVNTPAVNLHYDLAVDATGRAAPSPAAAGLPDGVAPAPLPTGSRVAWIWAAAALGGVLLAGSIAWTLRAGAQA
ncbi:MAG TPA: DUF2330 domain-containing protein [Actinomycetota bacterium]|nr:DUF2330 domain-containing protein [Actinomycetota bacterium]